MKTPEVSVVIPVHNGGRTLARAIESVLAQNADIELFVVDDASTDDSAAVAARYPEVQLLRTGGEAPAGPGRARNMGIQASTAPLLAFNDADDAWEPDKLRIQRAALEADPDLGYVLCAFRNVVDEGYDFPAWARKDRAQDALPGFVFQAMLVHRWCFDQVGRLLETSRWAEDTDWFLRARDAGVPMRHLPEVLVRRHLHDQNLSGDVMNAQRGLLHAIHASVRRRR